MKLPRTLIIDASILFSFFNKDSARRRIIEELPNLGCELISPEFAFKELMSDKEKTEDEIEKPQKPKIETSTEES